MKRQQFILKFAVYPLLILVLISCTGKRKRVSFVDEKGKFKAEFNVRPTQSTDTAVFEDERLHWNIFLDDKPDKNNLHYLIRYSDLPQSLHQPDSLLDLHEFFLDTQSDLLDSLGIEGLARAEVKQIQKHPGRQYTWVDKQHNFGYKRRVYLVNHRIYLLELKYKLENEFNRGGDLFFDLFRLINTSDNPNPEPVAEKPIKNFEASFPGLTSIKEITVPAEYFGNINMVMEFYEPKQRGPEVFNTLYAVLYAKLPEDKLKLFTTEDVLESYVEKLRASFNKQYEGKVLYDTEIKIDGHPGHEFIGTMLSGTETLTVKMAVINGYLYQLMVSSKKDKENNLAARKFFESFKVVK